MIVVHFAACQATSSSGQCLRGEAGVLLDTEGLQGALQKEPEEFGSNPAPIAPSKLTPTSELGVQTLNPKAPKP